MAQFFRMFVTEITGVLVLAVVLYIVLTSGPGGNTLEDVFNLPPSVLNLNTIFLGILIEAIPFVLIGVLIAGLIQVFVTEDHIRRWLPRNRYLSIVMSCTLGALFPACECGIVPIIRRLVGKGVPLYAAVGFMLTGPLINPIVIFSTYMAFGFDARIAWLRMLLGFVIALIVAVLTAWLFQGHQLKHGGIQASPIPVRPLKRPPLGERLDHMFRHAIDEFFDMGKYLIIGAFLAAFVQTYISAQSIFALTNGAFSSVLTMMGLAYVLSLCSEADAFIAASFRNLFSTTSLLAFMVFGPMIDLKNTLMLASAFRLRFVMTLLFLVSFVVMAVMMLVNPWI